MEQFKNGIALIAGLMLTVYLTSLAISYGMLVIAALHGLIARWRQP